jgi:hypothetical protein
MNTKKGLRVMLASGDFVKCEGCCPNLEVEVEGIPIKITVYVVKLGGSGIIVGVHWLRPLGNVMLNFQELSCQFTLNGKAITWKGRSYKELQTASITEISKHPNRIAYMALVQEVGASDEGEQNFSGNKTGVEHPVLVQLLQRFQQIFEEPTTIPEQRQFDHKIVLKDSTKAVDVKPYRYAQVQKREIEQQVQNYLQNQQIRHSASPFASPVLLVKKKDGGWRMCVDYRELNKNTVKDKFPMPIIDDLLDELGNAKYFSKLDLRAGYHQIRVAEEDIPKTAFRTHNGHFEFVVMPFFGLCNAPATFQANMNEIFRPYLRRFVLVFFDDILVYSPSLQQHMGDLEKVLSLLQEHKFFVKRNHFVTDHYLGHTIGPQGLGMEDTKVQAILQWPTPKNVKELRGFLGLAGYYRRFIRDFGKITQPFNAALQKGGFGWTEEMEEAFATLKTALTKAPTLALPDFSKGFVVECDASGRGMGAVLMQEGHPVAFMSKAYKGRQAFLPIYEREMLAILIAVRKWRQLLLGRQFIIRTDQLSLKYIEDQQIRTEAQEKWLTKLLGFDYRIEYKPGDKNVAADALSRRPQQASTSQVSGLSEILPRGLQDAEI